MRNSSRSPAYAFCEPRFQTGVRSHIRQVGPDGTLFSHGGIPVDHPGLCGLDLAKGWDVEPRVSAATVRDLLARNQQAQPSGQVICGGCAEAYLATVAD